MKKRFFVLVIPLLALLALLGFHDGEPEIKSQWNGAKVAFLGDSITDEGQLGGQDIYWNQLRTILGIKPYCYGISGHRTTQILGQARQLLSEHGQDVDAIIIFIGTNDFNGSRPLGEWFEEGTVEVNRDGVMTSLRHRTPVMEGNTVRSDINIFMSFLKHNYPTKQVILLTPIHRGFSTFGPQNIQPEESFPNRLGYYFSEYADVVKEAGNVWGIPVIDLNSLSGLNPMVEEQVVYFSNPETDKLHPNGKGHERIARTLMYQLLVLPCRF